MINLTNNLVGYWKLNDNAANRDVVDSSGEGRTGDASRNTEDMTTTGKLGGAFLFADGDKVLIPHIANDPLYFKSADKYSFAFHVLIPTGISYGGILGSHRFYMNTGFVIDYDHSSGRIRVYSLNEHDFSVRTNVLSKDVWHQIGVTYDNELCKIYVNGNFIMQSDSIFFVDTTGGAPFAIGTLIGWDEGWASTATFCGKIDQVQVWHNRILNLEEFQFLSNAGNGTEAITGHFYKGAGRGTLQGVMRGVI